MQLKVSYIAKVTMYTPIIGVVLIWLSLNTHSLPANPTGTVIVEGDMIMRPQSRYLPKGSELLWPSENGYVIIPYKINDKIKSNPSRLSLIKKSIQWFTDNTCLRWVDKYNNYPQHVSIENNGKCQADIGRMLKGNVLSLGDQCYDFYTIVHEMIHTIGFIHEHQRPDRDNYVDIVYENIPKSISDNFNRRSDLGKMFGDYDLPYDIKSVMQYRKDEFSKNENQIVSRDDPDEKLSCEGDKECPTLLDKIKINTVYRCTQYPSRMNYPKTAKNNNDGFMVGGKYYENLSAYSRVMSTSNEDEE